MPSARNFRSFSTSAWEAEGRKRLSSGALLDDMGEGEGGIPEL